MNNKENELNRIIDIVYQCTSMEIDENGTKTFSREDLIGKSRAENAVMARCILVNQLTSAGFSATTISIAIKKTIHTIRNLQESHYQYLKTSRAYRIADAEATIKCKDISA